MKKMLEILPAAICLGLLAAGPALASNPNAEPTVTVLTNDHLDMTREGLAEASEQALVEAAVEPAPEVLDIDDLPEIGAPEAEAVAPEPAVTAAAGETDDTDEEAAPEPSEESWSDEDADEIQTLAAPIPADPDVTYAVCMERSIRTGNSYDESDRVCGAVFSRWVDPYAR